MSGSDVGFQRFPFRDKLVVDARIETTPTLGLLMNLYVRISTRTSWNLFFEYNGYKATIKMTKMTPKIRCFREQRLCRGTKTHVCEKPLHTDSLNRFFLPILACHPRGTNHGETGGIENQQVASGECPSRILAPRTEPGMNCPQIALGSTWRCSGCARRSQ